MYWSYNICSHSLHTCTDVHVDILQVFHDRGGGNEHLGSVRLKMRK